jgi:hypothetical protein
MRGWGITALVALAGCEIVFPLSGPDPALDGAVADGPATVDADPLRPDAMIDAFAPPPPPDAVPACQAPNYECLGVGGNGTVPCSDVPFDYCPTLAGVLDALDPYDLCACGGAVVPLLYILDNGDTTATVVLVATGIDDAGLQVDMSSTCYADDVGCSAQTPSCGTVLLVAWYGIPLSAGGNQFDISAPSCNVPFYTFYR